MANKNIYFGLLIILIIGFTFSNCDLSDGSTFEFWIEHRGNVVMSPITKVEFINGSSENSPVLQTEVLFLEYSQSSSKYKVPGFTNKHDGENNEYIFGVRLTLENGNKLFGSSKEKYNGNVRILSNGLYLYFDDGTWF